MWTKTVRYCASADCGKRHAGRRQVEITVSADAMEQMSLPGDLSLSGSVQVTGEKLLMHTGKRRLAVTSRLLCAFHSSLPPKSAILPSPWAALPTYDARTNILNCTGPVVITRKAILSAPAGPKWIL